MKYKYQHPACYESVRTTPYCGMEGFWFEDAQICIVYYHLGCYFGRVRCFITFAVCAKLQQACIMHTGDEAWLNLMHAFFLSTIFSYIHSTWKYLHHHCGISPYPVHWPNVKHVIGRMQYFYTSNQLIFNWKWLLCLQPVPVCHGNISTQTHLHGVSCTVYEQICQRLLHVIYLTALNHMTF